MNQEKKPSTAWWQPGLNLFVRLSSWIAAPVLVAVGMDKWLDGKYHTAPWLFLASVGVAFVVSMVAIVIVGIKEMDKINKESKK